MYIRKNLYSIKITDINIVMIIKITRNKDLCLYTVSHTNLRAYISVYYFYLYLLIKNLCYL